METAALLLAAIVALALASNVSAQTTGFTYQGQLRSNNAPANGNFDLQFSVFAAASGGTELTTAISNPSVPVSNGVFSVLLDFGSAVFTGADRYLEIGVRPAGNVNPYTLLTPRQLISATPYAIRAGTATTATTVTGPIADSQLSANIPRLSGNNTFTGPVSLNSQLNVAGNIVAQRFYSEGFIAYPNAKGAIELGQSGVAGSTPFIDFHHAADDPLLDYDVRLINDSNHRLTLTAGLSDSTFSVDGRVGIGTDNPQAKLHIEGGNGEHFMFSLPGHATWNGGAYVDDSFRINEASVAPRFTIRSGGNIGIGTVSPGGLLHLLAADSPAILRLQSAPGGFGSGKLEFWSDAQGSIYEWRPASIRSIDAGGFTGGLAFIANGAGEGNKTSEVETMRIVNGKVGIGTTTPQAALDVAGNTNVSGVLSVYGNMWMSAGTALFGGGRLHIQSGSQPGEDLYLNPFGGKAYVGGGGGPGNLQVFGTTTTGILEVTGGSDIAEPFDVDGDDIPAGAVVVIDENQSGKLKLSDREYDTRVAGIVSGAGGVNPGLKLMQRGVLQGSHHVALAGRVYAQADAESAPIQPGDLLTTSARPGHVMRAVNRERAQGAILGKAMTPLKEGRGLVLVLISLQ